MKTDTYYSKDTDLQHRDLTPDEERALFARFHSGDLAAGDEIVENNLKYALLLALRHSTKKKYHAELVSAANYGLVYALHLRRPDNQFAFDPSKGRFTTFATKFIIGEMCKFFRVSGGVSFPAGKLPDWPDDSSEFDPEAHADVNAFKPENLDHDALFRALDTLPDTERQAIELLFFGGETVVDTAAIMGCSRQTVHQLRNRAMRKLKARLNGFVPFEPASPSESPAPAAIAA